MLACFEDYLCALPPVLSVLCFSFALLVSSTVLSVSSAQFLELLLPSKSSHFFLQSSAVGVLFVSLRGLCKAASCAQVGRCCCPGILPSKLVASEAYLIGVKGKSPEDLSASFQDNYVTSERKPSPCWYRMYVNRHLNESKRKTGL